VVVTELDSAISEYDSLMAEKNRLAVLAPFDGEIIELNDILTIGEWIAKDESLLSIGQFSNYQIEAFVAEAYLSQIQAGVSAKFYPEQLDWPSLPCRVVRIDNAAASQLSPVFTSRYKGSIAIRGNNKDVLVPETSVYRIWLQPETKLAIFRTLKGSVLIDGKSESIATSLARQVMAVVIRESGF
jgi:putative peptide zinc metalloprotease protein